MSKKERLDKVKKYGFCQRCLKSLKKVKHDIKQCPAPDCSNCGKDHYSLICREEKKEQKINKTRGEDEEGESDDSKHEDFNGDPDVFEDDDEHEGPDSGFLLGLENLIEILESLAYYEPQARKP